MRIMHPDAFRSALWGLLAAGGVLAGIYFGSRGLKDFDTALVPYAGASVFAAFGIGYRYAMWLKRPPTRLYWRRGWAIFLDPRRLPRNLLRLVPLFVNAFLLQRFIERRSPLRWAGHFCLFWGCVLAAAVTFPLSFGWIRFESGPSQETYIAFLFGIEMASFPIESAAAHLIFNVLVISAVLVLVGVFLLLWRRTHDPGALAVQQFADDLLPLILLFAISVTGLMLTVSARLLHGFHYVFLSQVHAASVIFTLLYLPFGKFFHIFQRPAQLGVDFYRRAAAEGEPARCLRCGAPFAARLHVEDLKRVEEELGIRYAFPGGGHYQDVCPSCRRKSVALRQDALWRRADGRS